MTMIPKGYNQYKLHCAKCKTTDAPGYYPIEYPEDDGTITPHYGCDQCIDEMYEMVDARKEA